MKRTLFAFSLLALLFMGITSAQAQSVAAPATPVKAAMTPLEAYKMNFTNAVNEGNLVMADAHRQKLASYMEREIQVAESGAKPSPQPTKPSQKELDAAKDLARQKEILGTFRSLDLSTAAALTAAKDKLALIDEFSQLSTKRQTADN